MSKDGVVTMTHQADDRIEYDVETTRESASGRWQGETLHLDSYVERFEDAAVVGRWVRDPELSTVYELRFTKSALVGTRNGNEIVLIPCPDSRGD